LAGKTKPTRELPGLRAGKEKSVIIYQNGRHFSKGSWDSGRSGSALTSLHAETEESDFNQEI